MAAETSLSEYGSLPLLFKHLKRILVDNTEYFEQYSSKAVYKKLHDGFKLMLTTMDGLEENATLLAKKAPLYDYSVDVKGNGYRSLIRLVEQCIRSVTDLAAYCQSHRDRFFFRSHHYSMEVDAFAKLFQRTAELLQFAKVLVGDSVPDKLFPECFDSELLFTAEQLDRECFYGRTLGFQFSTAIGGFMQVVCVAMASFAEGYHKHKTNSMSVATVSLLNSGKYTINPEMRAKQIVEVTQKTNTDFSKAFWNLTESYGIQHVPLLVGSALKVNRVFYIPPEPFEVETPSGEVLTIVPPCSWSGPAPVQVRLLSYEWRKGQSKDGTTHHGQMPKPKSDGLMVHAHGGGFVAQSSKSHEMYLRSWAKELSIPILSIDYSLAPEAPFPRALEECFFVYAWCLNNLHQLGTTGKFVCVAGDSAGGNLCVSLSMRAAEHGIRVPDHILVAYAPFNAQWVPSPSRLLSIMDPLLPIGVLAGCLAAYAGMGRSPFDENFIMKNPGKSLTGRTSQPINVGERSKIKSLTHLLGIASKESKHHDSRSDESFHSCTSSPDSLTGYSSPLSNDCDTVVGSQSPKHMLHCNGLLHCQENNFLVHEAHKHSKHRNEPSSIGREVGYESDCTSSEHSLHPRSRKHSEDSVPSRCTSPQGGRHGNRIETEHVAVYYHSDIEECHVVNVIERPGSPDGELLLFPLESPGDGPYLDTGTLSDEGEEGGHEEEPSGMITSMSRVQLLISKNPYMSPLLASDEMLKSLPPIDIVACTLDPLLDDSVKFAKRLRSLNKDVELYILEDLPHGFLSFHLVSQQAREGNNLCVVCLKRTLTGKRKVGNVEKVPVY